MPFGITNATNVTIQNITQIINVTDPTEFLINVNEIAYGGWFYFILLWVLGIILYVIAQEAKDQPVINAMYIMSSLTILSFFLRAIQVVNNGIVWALVSDFQMWIFPVFAILLAGVVWFTRQ